MKLTPVYVAKIARREDKIDKNRNPYAVFSLPFESTEKDPADASRYKTIWLTATVYADKTTGELPRMLNYLTKGSVVGVEASITTREWIDRDGKTRTSVEFAYPRFHFVPKPSAEEPDETSVDVSHASAATDEPDPFADEA